MNSKLIGIVVLILLLGFAAYSLFLSGPAPTSTATLGPDGQTQEIGNDTLTLLTRLQGVQFRTTLLFTPAFQSLIDWSIKLPSIGIGRPNPFERIGVDTDSFTLPVTQSVSP